MKHKITLETYNPCTEESNDWTEYFGYVVVESDYEGANTLGRVMVQESEAFCFSVEEIKGE